MKPSNIVRFALWISHYETFEIYIGNTIGWPETKITAIRKKAK